MTIHRTTLQAKPREGSGKGSARRLRAQGLIPAVVYGRHLGAPAHIAVDPVAIKQAIATPSHLNTLITLKLDGAPEERQVLLKDVQLDPLSRQMVHADFLDVREDRKK
jgi:large subunit ribosomal protein L25